MHVKSQADEDMREAFRVAGHVVRQIMQGKNKAAADLIGTFDNQQNLSIVLATYSAMVTAEMPNPDPLLDAYFWQEEEQSPVRERTKTAQARQLISEVLADGKRHRYVVIRARALSEGLGTKELANAAQQLGVRSGNVNASGHWWQLPPPKARPAPKRAYKPRSGR